MLCRACGMQSQTNDVCEWCKKPLHGGAAQSARTPAQPLSGAPAAPPVNGTPLNGNPLNGGSLNGSPLNGSPLHGNSAYVPPVPPLNGPPGVPPQGMPTMPGMGLNAPQPTARIQRTTLTGEVIEVPATSAPGPGPADPNATTVMTPSGLPYAGAAYAAMQNAGVSYNTMAPQMLRDKVGLPEVSLGEKWEKFLAFAAPILLLSAWLVHLQPGYVMWIGFIDLFVLSLIMGATGAVPSYDDSHFDVAIMLVVTFLFGPILALVVYLLTAAVKQECNGAVVGLLTLQILLFQGMTLAFASSGDALHHVGVFMMFGFMQFFAVFVGFLGWLLSSFFRPVGE